MLTFVRRVLRSIGTVTMDTIGFGRTVAALVILVVFTFWGFAVSLAHESLPIAPLHTIDWRAAHAFGSSQAERPALRLAMDVLDGQQPRTPRSLLNRCPISLVSYGEPTVTFAPLAMAAVKVSLPISKSVLLL